MNIKGKTATGFAFTVSEDIRDDMELLEQLVAIDKGDLAEAPALVKSLLGEEQKKRLYDHCRGKNGRVSSKKVFTEIKGIFDAIKDGGESDLKN